LVASSLSPRKFLTLPRIGRKTRKTTLEVF
jgi:hypothetical protein